MKEIFSDTNKKEVSLALIDCFYHLETNKNQFLDLDLFEIQLIKHGIELDDKLEIFFNNFISQEKTKEETSEYSLSLAYGIKYKYKKFNENIQNLGTLYSVIFWIETHTEFKILKYVDEIFTDDLSKFYEFISFYAFKKENVEIVEEFYIKDIKNFINDGEKNHFHFQKLELIFNYLKHTELIIENFLLFSKDKEYLEFIIMRKEVAQDQIIKKIISKKDFDEYVDFLLFVITFNPHIVISDFLIDIFKKNHNKFYLFLKAIFYKQEFYTLNNIEQDSIQLFLKYLFKDFKKDYIKELILLISSDDITLFKPLIIFSLNQNNDELVLLLLFKITKSKINSSNFMIIYGLFSLIIENIKLGDLKQRATNIFIGTFKTYLTSDKKSELSEIKNFFIIINLFLIKIDLDINIKEKLFRMNLKLFDNYLKFEHIMNPILLNLSRHYMVILNKYLKEYDSDKDIALFLSEIKDILDDDNQIMFINLIDIDLIDPEEKPFNFISKEIKKYLLDEFKSNSKKLTIYPILETDGIIISKSFFNFIIFLKVTLIYDFFYPFFNKLSKNKVKIKKDRKKIYILNNKNTLLNELKLDEIRMKPKGFYYHFINKVYSVIIISVSSLLGFRIVIDGFIVNDTKLLLSGFSLIIFSLIIDLLLFFFFKKFDKLYFFEIEIDDKVKIFYSEEDTLSIIIN